MESSQTIADPAVVVVDVGEGLALVDEDVVGGNLPADVWIPPGLLYSAAEQSETGLKGPDEILDLPWFEQPTVCGRDFEVAFLFRQSALGQGSGGCPPLPDSAITVASEPGLNTGAAGQH